MRPLLFFISFLLISCNDPVSHKVDTINAVVTTGKVRTDHLPRVVIEANVLQSYPQIENRIVLDFTDYLKTKKLPPANATYSVILVRQKAPNYFFTVVSTMYDTK